MSSRREERNPVTVIVSAKLSVTVYNQPDDDDAIYREARRLVEDMSSYELLPFDDTDMEIVE